MQQQQVHIERDAATVNTHATTAANREATYEDQNAGNKTTAAATAAAATAAATE